MNARDSEKLSGILEQAGLKEIDSEHADFVLYNTCTVRDNANQKVLRTSGLSPYPEEKTAGYDDCPLRLHDAAGSVIEKNWMKLFVCGFDFRNSQYF